ncbi:MAG: GTP-binding protein [Sulfurovum sp.]|nr:GTP-binding protein [Sulfurovum sp.]
MFAYKIVMVGDFGVGKTSLVKRFVDNSFSEEYLSSIGVSMSKKQFTSSSDVQSTMILWDIEGKTEYKPIFKQYLTGAKAFIIVVDLTRPATIDKIQEHIQLCLESSKDASIIIALNKCDLEIRLEQSLQELQDLSPNILSVYKTSAKTGNAVNEIFNSINENVISKI